MKGARTDGGPTQLSAFIASTLCSAVSASSY